MFKLGLRSLTAAAALAFVAASPASSAYFDGKTIKLVVGFGAGGGVDIAVRTFAQFYGKYVPGNPKIVVQNLPGAGGAKVVNFIYEKAKPDGQTLLFSPSKLAEEMLQIPGIRSKHERFGIVGYAADKYLVWMSNKVDGGVNKPTDIGNISSTLKMSARSLTAPIDLIARLQLDMLGVKYRFIPGYRGEAKMLPALLNGEVQIFGTTLAAYRASYEPNVVKSGKAVGLFHYPTVQPDGAVIANDPDFPDMPGFSALHKATTGKAPSGTVWEAIRWLRLTDLTGRALLAPPGTPAEAIRDLQIGFKKVQADPAYRKAHRDKFGADWLFSDGDNVKKLLKTISGVDPKVISYLKNYIATAQKEGK